MPLGPRLRDALRREVDDIHPNVESHLEAVTSRHERRSGGAAGLAAAAAVIVVILLVLVQPGRLRDGSNPGAGDRTPGPGAASPDGVSLLGSWVVTLTAADPDVDALGMAGDWTIRIGADSTFKVVPPEAFRTPSGRQPSGYVHAEDGDSFLTTLFARDYAASCAGSGRYTWSVADARLSFAAVEDTCAARRTLLTTRPWSVAAAADPG